MDDMFQSMVRSPVGKVFAGALAAAFLSAGFLACDPPVEDDDDLALDDDDTADDDDAADDDDTGGDDDTGDPNDQDGDGFTPSQGDCDDHNEGIYPGATDGCDEWDNDCDGQLNEDSPGYDDFEPNDDTGEDLGDMTDVEETYDSFIHAPGDVDRFRFFVEDGYIGYFYVDAELITVPAATDLSLELIQLEDDEGAYVGPVASVDDGGSGDGEYLSYGGSAGTSDTGIYELVIRAEDGYDCLVPYILLLDCGG